MTFATRLTKVGNGREHFDQRTRMCYHKVPPSERVVAQVGNAGQAKPHREHNPLSLLGARLATPIRKLNDPVGRRPHNRLRNVNAMFLTFSPCYNVPGVQGASGSSCSTW